MSVYLIADIQIQDRNTYEEYVRQARPLVQQHGGIYRVQGGNAVPLSGGWTPERIVMIEFPSMEALQACFASEAYQRIAPLRTGSTTSRGIIVTGCDAETMA